MTKDDQIEKMVKDYGRMLIRIAATRLDDIADAEDAVQDVFCKVISSNLRFIDAEHERAWLIRASINRASDLRKHASRKNVPLDEALDVPDMNTDGDQEVLHLVRSLPKKYALPLHLHYFEGFSLTEIGQILNIPAATVGTHLARGRKRLERMIQEGNK